jgi:dienelactone hydrolase
MRRLDVQIPTPDGHCNATLHVRDADGPWPGVLVFPDAGGTRETFWQMGDRLASMGYVALIPDMVYVADAIDDGSFTAEQAELLESALSDAGVDHGPSAGSHAAPGRSQPGPTGGTGVNRTGMDS